MDLAEKRFPELENGSKEILQSASETVKELEKNEGKKMVKRHEG